MKYIRNKYVFVIILLLSILVVSFGFTNIYVSHHQPAEDEDFVVVTSFYPMYIATMNVVGDTEGVTLKNLSEPQTGCLHDFQLTPADMKLLSTADVFIINGGGIESFMEEIAKQYPDLVIIEACEDIELLCETEAHGHEHGEDLHGHESEDEHEEEENSHDGHNHDINAHVWMSVELYRQQVENIANGLVTTAPNFAESFLANAGDYDRKLEELQVEQDILLTLTEGEEVIMFHCAYDYVAEELGLEAAFC
ncbi:MAG: zinc ABC transporter substrate-binding protein, partial [Agathobacter sp.]|nr:zinc ABC transporter substrate-binding protein [Agathobacter sp.]